jgi:hypothetical protein
MAGVLTTPAAPRKAPKPPARKSALETAREAVQSVAGAVARRLGMGPSAEEGTAPSASATSSAAPVAAGTESEEPPAPKTPRRRRRRLAATREEPLIGAPSSLDMDARSKSAGIGVPLGAEFDEENIDRSVTAGDADVDAQQAAVTGEEAPGGDNPTPDQDVVDLIGKALGVEYDDNQELKGGDELRERDRKRWELDPASAEDYKERRKG